MMWHEFIAGTGCRDTEHNYQVYKDLEIMYMNSDMSKEKIYAYGVKLVDNSLTDPEWAAYYKAAAKEKRTAAKALQEQVKMYRALLIMPDTNTTSPEF